MRFRPNGKQPKGKKPPARKAAAERNAAAAAPRAAATTLPRPQPATSRDATSLTGKAVAARGVTAPWQAIYLQEVSEHYQKGRAARAAGISLRLIAHHRTTDPAFEQAELEAIKGFKDFLEAEVIRRAVDGVVSTYFNGEGKIIRERTEYSDLLLVKLLERTETGMWRQKQMIEQHSVHHFATRAERKAALEKARQEAAEHRAAATGGGLQAQPATAPALPST